MYLKYGACANCLGKFDDTYKAGAYNTKLDKYEKREDLGYRPYFCCQKCADDAIGLREFTAKHRARCKEVESDVEDEARAYDRQDDEDKMDYDTMVRVFTDQLKDARKERDQNIDRDTDVG